jgi:hypothetical protein
VDTLIKTATVNIKKKTRLPIGCVFLTSSTRSLGNERCKLCGRDVSCADGGEQAPIVYKERER